MNYKVVNNKFIPINEESGLIENNTSGIIELAITDSKPIENDEENIRIEPHGKYYFYKEEGNNVYVRLVNRVSGFINVFEANLSSGEEYLPLTGGTINGNLTVTGTILSNDNITAYSDIRLKENLNKIDNALDKVRCISGYTYNMKGNDKKRVGVIAQEINEVLPEVVVQDDKGFLTVDYGKITALLIEAIKELEQCVNK